MYYKFNPGLNQLGPSKGRMSNRKNMRWNAVARKKKTDRTDEDNARIASFKEKHGITGEYYERSKAIRVAAAVDKKSLHRKTKVTLPKLAFLEGGE